jgi:hypothetical protein
VRKTWKVVDIIITVPSEIPLWSFRTMIRKMGLKTSVETLINQLPEEQKQDALEHWEYGNYIVRNHPLIISIGLQLALSEQEIDNVFISGSMLT